MLLAFNLKYILITYQKKIPGGLALAPTLSRSVNTWGLHGHLCWQMLTPAPPRPPTQQEEWELLWGTPNPAHTSTAGVFLVQVSLFTFPRQKVKQALWFTQSCVHSSKHSAQYNLSRWKNEWTNEDNTSSKGTNSASDTGWRTRFLHVRFSSQRFAKSYNKINCLNSELHTS